MRLPLALLLAVPLTASAQLKNERGCSGKQETMIQAALPEARKRVAAAQEKVKAKDPKAAEVGKLLIGGYNEAEVGQVLDWMAAALGSPTVKCSGEADKNCGSRAGYVRSDEKGIIHLCPKFFNEKNADDLDPADQRVRTLVHESAHMAHPNISEPGGESYCVLFTCKDSCGDGPYDEGQQRNVSARVADNWSQFVHCAGGQKPDEEMVISASPKKKK